LRLFHRIGGSQSDMRWFDLISFSPVSLVIRIGRRFRRATPTEQN
jgi:hypothetical protein